MPTNYINLNKHTSLRSAIKGFFFVAALLCIHSLSVAQCKRFVENKNLNPLKNFTVKSGFNSYPFFVDIDGDGDMDCFTGEYNKNSLIESKIYFFRNDGTNQNPRFNEISGTNNPLARVSITGLTIPNFIDVDSDGDYDCFISDNTSGGVRFYKNIGTIASPIFEKQSAAMNPLRMVKFSGSYIAESAFADVDGDGDYDCLVTDMEGNELYFKNSGTAKLPHFELATGSEDPFSFLKNTTAKAPSFFDWNHDGLIDLFLGTNLYKNTGTATTPVFAADKIDNPDFSAASLSAVRWVNLKGNLAAVTGTASGGFDYLTTSPGVSINPQEKQVLTAGNSLTLTAATDNAVYHYQWLKDGNAIAGETTNKLVVKDAGRYSLDISNTCGSASSEITYVIAANNNDDLAINKNGIRINAYPNPSRSEFVLSLPAGLSTQTLYLKVSDAQGKVLKATEVSGATIRFGKELQQGTYFVQLLQGTTPVYKQKLIKE